MYQFSDSESSDSDEGIRFKTDSTRNKSGNLSSKRKSRSRSRSPRNRYSRRNSRERSSRKSSLKKSHKRKRRKSSSRGKSPPKSTNNVNKEKPTEASNSKTTEGTVVIGPLLPPHLSKSDKNDFKSEEVKEQMPLGPQLPPHLLNKKNEACIGPQLPPHLLSKQDNAESCIGPQLPSDFSQNKEESDEEIYGPLPADELTYSKSQIALEERALQLKMDQLEPTQDKAPVREEWMLELPEVKAAKFGLGPRQFKSKPGPDFSNRSSWTDTPNKPKTKEIDLKKEAEIKEIQRRDEEQEKMSKKHKKKHTESLLEMHQNKMKNKKKEEETNERRPFSREIDLQVNRFDEAQKKAVLKKARLLDDRFSSGQSKFL